MKNTKLCLFICFIAVCLTSQARAEEIYEPSGTYLFAQKDTCELFLDVYEPSAGSVRTVGDAQKPTVLFMFGGGFMSGSRNDKGYHEWYRMLNEAGYRVVAIDYRLGLKGIKNAGMNPSFIKNLRRSIDLAVEDLFSATLFILENSEELGIDPHNIVISGSSAGAMTALQAEWEICNGRELASVLPEGFNYAGVMAFSGAIFSNEGSIKYAKMESCPTFMCHGTADSIVPYTVIKAFNLCFAGTDEITEAMKRQGGNYNTFRFTDHGHEIANGMVLNFNREIEFLELNVMQGLRRTIDATVDDPRITVPSWAKGDFKSIYKK